MSYISKIKIISLVMMLIVAGIIFYTSSLPVTAGQGGTSWTPIAYHLGVFFCLASFMFIALSTQDKIKKILITLSLSFMYALSDEIHQLFVPNRTFSLEDIIVDCIGILSSIVMNILITKIKKINREIE